MVNLIQIYIIITLYIVDEYRATPEMSTFFIIIDNITKISCSLLNLT
jgi:hypothetical protein